ncbi:histidinol-phosphate aminotransferase family protein (plasmid) [Deinococcus taeanensis]|uniref:pyridoxal phosphate-dependent aminotransferase n=1 Tax=Deinococcus taeanensis TaxID=2737050 RepID=UPI001CDBB012|nr:histidinol-phosphate transaminase [Deinococcus taeanensis]UBV44875.1 histidinol-phosphate aminotransferase family protein [Deinococcus taeanensis]
MNTNPFGPNPALIQAVRDAGHDRYPDPAYTGVRERLGAWHGVDADSVGVAVGASDLLHRLARATLAPGDTLLSVRAPFGELARAAALARAQVVITPDLPAELPAGTRLLYVGYPHNPTGFAPPPGALLPLADRCAQAGALLVVDEAYAPFTALSAPPSHPALVRVLSPGKAHGLVGARPAYALAHPDVIAALDNLAPAWHVPAGTAGVLAALPYAAQFLAETLPRVAALASDLAGALDRLGRVEHHGTPFMTLRVGAAGPVSAQLLDAGLRVRDCASYGLPDCIRVSTRHAGENAALVRALKKLRRVEARHG